ncbi:glycosyltransferase [Sphaerisporangium sp. NBC_01403]|uniref:glycosyltransferase family 2 protein n=1 Tax=Sphaerisporangium sp. NBC_01403 TaxID=2903599 RepID=UPI00325613E6
METSVNAPRVSVIIPNYNYAKTLEACLESVFSQTLPPYEVIVSDDASTDGSPEIAERFPCRLVRAPRNRGVSAARNAGVAASTGDILFFMDSDQALASDAIEQAVKALRDEAGYDCVHGVIAPEPMIDDGPVEWVMTMLAHFARMRAAGPTVTVYFQAAAMHRSVFEDVGPFDESLRDFEDVEYSERLSAKYRIGLSDKVVVYHDDEDRLPDLLSEQYRRSQLMIPFVAAHRNRPGALRPNSTLGVAMASLTVATLPAFLVSRKLAALPLLSATVFACSNPGLYRFVLRRRGPRFLGRFAGIHFLLNVAIAAGAAAGGLRSLRDPDFGRPAVRGGGSATSS